MLGTRACLHADQARRVAGDELRKLRACELPPADRFAGTIGADHMEAVLADINAQSRNIHNGLPRVGLIDPSILPLEPGADHPISGEACMRRELVGYFQTIYGVSERRAIRASGFQRSTHRYKSRSDPQVELRMRLKELAESRVRYGYRCLHALLWREGWQVNHKRIYRLYSEEGMLIRTRSPRRRRACRTRSSRSEADAMNDLWAMDFMSDGLFDDQPFRILTIVDCHTRDVTTLLPG